MTVYKTSDIRLLRKLLLEEHRAQVALKGNTLLCVFSIAKEAEFDDITHHAQSRRACLGRFASYSRFITTHNPLRKMHIAYAETTSDGRSVIGLQYPAYVHEAYRIPRSYYMSDTHVTLYMYGQAHEQPRYALVLHCSPDYFRLYSIEYSSILSLMINTYLLHASPWLVVTNNPCQQTE